MGRITRVVHTYYESPHKTTPVGSPSRSYRDTESNEQPYVRELVATGDWQLLDWGWVVNPSLVVICNEEASKEGTGILQPVIELWCGSEDSEVKWPLFTLFPREVFEATPNVNTLIFVRCGIVDHHARFTLTAFPG